MSVGTVTVTGKYGPGNTATAQSYANCRKIEIDCTRQMLRITDASDNIIEYATDAATTVTCTISGGNYTFTIS